MPRTKATISPSLRWSVFSRDGFTCRYCGAQAGQEGVELHADHVVAESEGGDTSYDNLATSCSNCNHGKGARSLKTAPTTAEVVERINDRAKLLRAQARAIGQAIAAQHDLEQQAVNLKCAAYQVGEVQMDTGEKSRIAALCREFGPDQVLEWYSLAAARNVSEWKAIRYVSGIVRNVREQREASNHA